MKTMAPFLILLLATASGCVTRVETIEKPHPVEPPRQAVTDKRVVIDPALAQVIRIVGIKSTSGSEGFLKMQVNVENLTAAPRQFSYRIDWFDRLGVALPMADSSLLPWMLLGHEVSFLAATAPTPAAKDFRITFVGPGN
jgi:uncharacterized protein YcfL